MTETKSIEQRLSHVMQEVLFRDVDPQSPQAKLIEDYGANSMDLVEIAEGMEQEFGVAVKNTDIPNFKTFGDVVALISAQQT